MKEARYFYVPDAATAGELPDEEASHAVRVLRMQPGDGMVLMDGRGCYYEAEVTVASQKRCLYKITAELPQERQWQQHFHLAIAPTKMMDRMEWMAEKITEVGIDELTFLDCKFSERMVVKLPRVEKIVVSAVKQSRKAWMPKLNEMTPFKEFISRERKGRKFIAHCYDEVERTYLFDELKNCGDDEITVLVGPEGDFSIDEVRMAVEAGFTSVHLGKSRLRTETAGLSAVMMMHLSR